jgi:hypothetical protein
VRLGAWLLSKGKITDDQLEKALQHQTFFGGRLGSSLIKLGYIDEDVLGAFLSDVCGAPYAPPSLLENIPRDVIAVVPGRLAAQYRVVPIAVDGRRLRLAMRDPKDLIALDEIAFLTGLSIEPYIATEFRIQRALERYYDLPGGTRSTIPVVSGGPPPGRHAPASTARPAGGVPPSGRELGLDGYPLDADPETIGRSSPGRAAIGPPAGTTGDLAVPTSLEEWRAAQSEIPEEIPEPDRPGAAAVAPFAFPAAAPLPAASVTPLAPPTGPAEPAPSIEEIGVRLRSAEARDEVFQAILDFTAARFRRSALFIVQQERILGWSGRGPGIDPARVRQATVPLDRPSLFSCFRRGADYYHGPVPDLPANTRFYFDLGCPAPARAFLAPVQIKSRPTLIVYADNEAEAAWKPDLATFRRLLAKAALALEILILKNKIATL